MKTKKLIAILTAVIMLISAIPYGTVVFAEEPQEKSGIDEIKEQSPNIDTFAQEKGYKLKTKSVKPAAFDLRHVDENGTEKSYITPVKVQNPYGTCWGFGGIAAAESSIISSGLSDGEDASTFDLSEKHLTWYAANAIADKSNSQYGEGAVFKERAYPQDYYNIGGGTGFATSLFASGVGPVRESTATEEGYLFAYRGKNGEVNSEKVTWIDDEGNEQSGIRKTSYSDEDDWTLPEKYRFNHEYQLRESYLLPNPINDDGEYNPEATEAIKEQLLNKRAVSISFEATHSVAGEDTSETEDFRMSANWAQYSSTGSQNHVVTIVGYDDNYPQSNFVKGNEPPGDGAWLVKNSWGSDLNEFPNNGYAHWGLLEGQDVVGSSYTATSKKHTGYFWLSYYDASISGPEAYIFEKSDNDIKYNQYDYMVVADYGEYSTEAQNKMANVFTAERNEELREVSLFTATPGTKATYSVYLFAEEAESPEDGVCVYTSEEKEYPFGGYHREKIDAEAPVYLCKGQKYAVVVEEKTPSGKYSLSFGINDVNPKHDSNPRMFNSVINKGESFLYIDGKWLDMADKEVMDMLLEGTEDNGWNKCADNFPIKAFTSSSPSVGAYIVVTNRNKYNVSKIDLKLNDEMLLLAQFKGATDELDSYNPSIKWEVSDPEVLSLETVDGNDFKVNIKGKKAGVVFLTADTGKYGKRVVKIEILKPEIITAEFDENNRNYVYTGKAIEPELARIAAEATDGSEEYVTNLLKDKDYIIEYDNNVRCGKATATVRGIGEYVGVIENNEFFENLTFTILPAKAKINKVTSVNDTLKVEFVSQKDTGIDGYVVTCKESGSKTVKTKKIGASATSAVIDGLTKGKTYEISLQAYFNAYDNHAIYNEEYDDYEGGYKDFFGEASNTVKATIPAPETAKKVTVKKPALKKVKAGKRSFKALWKKVKNASGYQIQYSLKKNMKKSKKITVKGKKKTKRTVKKLKKNKKYYVRVRAYKVVNGKKVYSKWSKKKAVRIK